MPIPPAIHGRRGDTLTQAPHSTSTGTGSRGRAVRLRAVARQPAPAFDGAGACLVQARSGAREAETCLWRDRCRDGQTHRAGEGLVQALKLLGAKLRAEVSIGGRELGVAEEMSDEHGVGGAGDETAGGVPETVQADGSEPAVSHPVCSAAAGPRDQVAGPSDSLARSHLEQQSLVGRRDARAFRRRGWKARTGDAGLWAMSPLQTTARDGPAEADLRG